MESGSSVGGCGEAASEDTSIDRAGNGEEWAAWRGAKYVLMFGPWCCAFLAAADAALTKRLCQAPGQYALLSLHI